MDPTALTLASDSTSTISLTLTGGFSSASVAVVEMSLTVADLNDIKVAGICQTASSCYLSITSVLARDLSGNLVVPILSNSALAVSH